MIFNNPLLLFFREQKEFNGKDLSQHLSRNLVEHFELHKGSLSKLKSGIPEEAIVQKPHRPHITLVGTVHQTSDLTCRDHGFLGFHSWLPSFAFRPSKAKFHIANIDQALWHPSLLQDAEGKELYQTTLSLCCDSLQSLQPSLIAHLSPEGKPLYLSFDMVETLATYLGYSDEFADVMMPEGDVVIAIVQKGLERLKEQFPAAVEKKETSWRINCFDSQVYDTLVQLVLADLQKVQPAPTIIPDESA